MFKPLRLRPGFLLRAYQFSSGGNGNGVVRAMPSDTEAAEPWGGAQERASLFDPPKPDSALAT